MLLVLILIHIIRNSWAYRPVYIIHGVLSNNISMAPMARRIEDLHPGTQVYIASRYEGWSSLEPMWRQVEIYGDEFRNMSKKHPEGFHLVGYSQGGLIARALLEKNPDHNVRSFISLSSPQAGQYGTKFLHLFFPQLACKEAYKLFYTVAGQLISIGNYWNDPHQQNFYLQYSAFLPTLNNEIKHSKSKGYKKGLTRLKKLVLIGGPDDNIITPWKSALFGYFDSNETVIDMESRAVFIDDKIGLKTLHNRHRLLKFVVNGVEHHMWKKNLTIIDNYIVPFLN